MWNIHTLRRVEKSAKINQKSINCIMSKQNGKISETKNRDLGLLWKNFQHLLILIDNTLHNWQLSDTKNCGCISIYIIGHHHVKSSFGANKCNQCEYAYSSKSSLKSHLKMHSGEKSNKCNQCNFASSRAGDLRTHLKTHSGEKSNKCDQCNFTFAQTEMI